MKFPSFPSLLEFRQWQAFFAMFASILGSAALTAFAAFLVWIMWKGNWPVDTAPDRIAVLGKALIISLSGSLVVLITLGFAINRRTIKMSREGFEATGGDGDTTTTTVTATATATIPDSEK